VVEDVFSALRLWQSGTTAVALLGTSLSDLKAAEIRRHAVGPVVVALDSDASARAINAARLHHFTYRRLLDADIKDMTEEQLDQWKILLTSSGPVSPIAKPMQS
jgi:DNA primase